MIKNPRTNRLMKIGSQMHRKAVKDGLLPGSTLGPIEEPIKPPTKHIEITEDPTMTEEPPEPIKKPIQKPIPQEEPEPIKRLMKQLAIQPEEYTPQPVKRTIKKQEQEFTTKEGLAEICTDIISENKKDFKKLSQEETDELLRKLLYKKLYDEKPKKSKEKKSKLKIKKAYSESESESD